MSKAGAVAVIGGGPAGLIAAEVLAAEGLQVTVYDHKPSVGRKFLLAGRGGLNITHSEPIDQLLDRYGPHRPKLERAIQAFPPDELRLWCAELGEATFAGSSGRVFPESFRATPLLRAWLIRLASQGVTLALRHRWLGWGDDPQHHRFEITARDGSTTTTVVESEAALFALGGASWPRVGSDGGWVEPFTAAGVTVVALDSSNCGVQVGWTDVYRDRFAGSPIKNVSVDGTRGDITVTESGLEGGPIYANSAALRRGLADGGPASLTIDLHPDLDHRRLVERLQKRRPKDSVSTWLRGCGLAPVAVGLMREATDNSIPHEPAMAAEIIKATKVPISALMPIERAISTAGGVDFDEIDESFELRQQPSNFVAGEMLDWDAPTGGYLLQACMSTGVAAAFGVLDRLG